MHTAILLASCPHLRQVKLGFTDDWEDTEALFEQITKKTILPSLERLELDYLRCRGEVLLLFLQNHRCLQCLSLLNLDITGNVTFKEILELLQCNHNSLRSFECRQIAQNGYRLYFATSAVIRDYGGLYFDNSHLCEDGTLVLDSFYEDFADLALCKYYGEAEEWEGVRDKLGILKDDLRLSRKDYRPDLKPWAARQYLEENGSYYSWSS